MPQYLAPLRDYRFCLTELFDWPEHRSLSGFEEFSDDVVEAVLNEAGKFSESVVFPLNRSGDEEGCTYGNGAVRTPQGFKEAYQLYCAGGWPSLACDPDHGGQGMPHMVNVLAEEMLGSANLSFSLYPGLTRGAYVAIAKFARAEDQALYLPRLASGEWTGAMCLTEAHSGSDLGLLRTAAVPNGDDSYAITGTKVFISAGEHDLTSNIVYLVLARLPDAPKGSRGISLFLVPKFHSDADGRLGARNHVSCGAIEHKMGIKGSATCVMNFDGAVGWLVGEPHQGLKAMFAMMNAERLAVGVSGLAAAEASMQTAVVYARQRLQGRAGSGHGDLPADPIIAHADVRRMLMTQRALIEGGRALAVWVARSLDRSEREPDPARRQVADDFVSLMTPVVKAFLTDMGSEVANLGMQVLGGHGYIRDNGQEQLVRDVRITQIYEGTNGIQALDLAGRKLPLDHGRLLRSFFHPLAEFIAASGSERAEFTGPLSEAFGRLQQATSFIAENPKETSAAATDYLHLFGLTAVAWQWARMADVARPKLEDDFYRAKLATARFYMQRILPRTSALHAAIMAGRGSVMELDEKSF